MISFFKSILFPIFGGPENVQITDDGTFDVFYTYGSFSGFT
jgi:hypothetical protein